MSQLYVSLRLYGAVVDQRVVAVRDGAVRLGEAEDAVVPFPGTDLLVRPASEGVWVRGRLLRPGLVCAIPLGAVEVTLEVLEPPPSSPGWDLLTHWRRLEASLDAPLPLPDLRILVATAAIVLAGSSWEAIGGFVSSDLVAENARIRAPESPTAEALGEADPPRVPVFQEAQWPPPVRLGPDPPGSTPADRGR